MILEVRGLSVSYRGIQAVRDTSLDIPEGSVTCIVGRNGAGKSSLVGAIAGIVRSTGACVLDGHSMTNRSAAHRARAGVSLVPESRRIFGTLSARENVIIGAPRRRQDWIAKYEEVLELFPDIVRFQHRAGKDLSGGEQQMVAIARALMRSPKLLILDEPSLGLAPIIVDRVMASVELLAQRGQSILLVEQNARLALGLSQRAYVMSLGRLKQVDHRAEDFDDETIMSLYL